MYDQVKFCFLELSGTFFPNIFDLCLVESAGAEPTNTEDGLCTYISVCLSVSLSALAST